MNKLITYLKDVDWYRFLPPYWFQNYPTSREWDKRLNQQLDKSGICNIYYGIAQIGPFDVWILNYPYAYGSLTIIGNTESSFTGWLKHGSLPKVATRKRLKRMVTEFVVKNM